VDNKVSKAVTFLKDHALEMWISKIAQEPKVVANLTSVDFIELFVKNFTREYQELLEGINLVQMRLTWPCKAYV
jgi:hypothetical protein